MIVLDIKSAPEGPPLPLREYFDIDLEPLFDRLAQGPITFSQPAEIPKEKLGEMIRGFAMRRNISVSIRHLDGQVWVRVRGDANKTSRREHVERNAEIVKARENGETNEAIARRFSISRQRVDQITVAKFSCLPIGAGRRDASLEFLQPYMQYIDKRFCVVCGEEAGAFKFICAPCRKLQTVIMKIKGYLTSYQNGNEQGRRQAVYLIRKHNIKPEYLAPAKAPEAQ